MNWNKIYGQSLCPNIYIIFLLLFSFFSKESFAQVLPHDSLEYYYGPVNITDESNNSSEDYLEGLQSVTEEVVYNIENNEYIITKKIGDLIISTQIMSFEDYMKFSLQNNKIEFQEEADKSTAEAGQAGIDGFKPKLDPVSKMINKTFGGTQVDIRPAGNIDLTIGGNWQYLENPNLSEIAQRQGNLDFDMDINMSTIGQIGDKMKIQFNYNTQAVFDFENQLNLNYAGQEDEIIQKLEAGNVSMTTNSLLIPGSQQLFGLKSELQFGRLTVGTILSNQKSEQKNLTLEGGSKTSNFEIKSNKYEENRHFLLSHYFRDNYNQSLSTLPFINSQANITRVEVWITNDQGYTEQVRDVVAFMDIAESEPHSPNIQSLAGPYAQNDANTLYGDLTSNAEIRELDQTSSIIAGDLNLLEGQDFIVTRARKLKTTEYTINNQLGFISLNLSLQPDQVVGIAYEYTINNDLFKVGEFAQDIPIDPDEPNVLFLKMLKNITQNPRLPLWDLMMKNIYPLGAFQIEQEDFRLDVLYQDPGEGIKRFLPSTEPNVEGIPLIKLLELDNLNYLGDPQPDGIFDYVEGLTIRPSNGRLIFPVLEPFGEDMENLFSNPAEGKQFSYSEIYDSTKTVALQYPEKNRFLIKGTYKSRISSSISLGGFNIPKNSVTVQQGGKNLIEGVDFTINYSLGQLQIINDAVLNSGVPLNVKYETGNAFVVRQKSLLGTRLDYWINDDFGIGGTLMRSKETAFTNKVNVGDDPISNMMYGLDVNYFKESPGLTKFIDKIPGIQTKEMSSVGFRAEVARFQPLISQTTNNQVFIDDFEGSTNNIDIKFPFNNWVLASTPKGGTESAYFPEAAFNDSLAYNDNRAKLAWYQMETAFCRNNNLGQVVPDGTCQNDYVRDVLENEIFPNVNYGNGIPNLLPTFDLALYPEEKGPYNFNTSDLNSDGTLSNPREKWGGVMRNIDYNDFEASNIEFIDFWVMDPFINDPNSDGGDLYFNLGEISEDVLHDSKKFFEDGLTTVDINASFDTSKFGIIPLTNFSNYSFDNDEAIRLAQDVGFDGLDDVNEAEFFADYLTAANTIVTDPAAIAAINADPANDNYISVKDEFYNQGNGTPVLDRYKTFNNPHGNSPIETQGNVNLIGNSRPDSEDLNRDNTLNTNESYFQYKVRLSPDMNEDNQPLITDIVEGNNGVNWYHFKIPIENYNHKVGGISDFRSIRFIRMFLTDFDHPVICRFARLDLVRNQWRRYKFSLLQPGENLPDNNGDDEFFNVTSVSIEQSSARVPIGYVLPPNVIREQQIGLNNFLIDEQSMSLQVCGLPDGDGRAVFKNLEIDMRQFKRIKMFTHAEKSINSLTEVEDGDVSAFIRIGTDFTSNYYEYEIPLKMTPYGSILDTEIWPEENNFDFSIQELVDAKQRRNFSDFPKTQVYSDSDGLPDGHKIRIIGTPDFGQVSTIMVGVRNPVSNGNPDDDGLDKCVEVWINELSLAEFNNSAGEAALATMDVKLADWGNISLSGSGHTAGFGTLEQKIADRFLDNYYQYDGTANFELGKFFPKKAGVRIPVRADYSKSVSIPKYDPYETDVLYDDKLALIDNNEDKEEYKKAAQTTEEIKSINFSNVRKVKTNNDKKSQLWDISNWNATYAYTEKESTDPIIATDIERSHFGSLGYNFSRQVKYITPFKKVIKSKSKWLSLIKDFNFNLLPNDLSFRTDVNRNYQEFLLRPLSEDPIPIDTSFRKEFNWGRFYNLKYNIGKGLSVSYDASNNSRIDEPEGRIDKQFEIDSIKNNIRDLGRTTNFQQNASIRYKVPFDKIPLTDWIDVKGQYNTSFVWAVGPLATLTGPSEDGLNLGNIITNTQKLQINSDLKMSTIYNKWGWLKKYTAGAKKSSKNLVKIDSDTKKIELNKLLDIKQKKKDELTLVKTSPIEDESKSREELKELKKGKIKMAKDNLAKSKKAIKAFKDKNPNSGFEALSHIIVKPLTIVKRVSINFTEDKGTTLPGFLHNPKYFGNNFDIDAPGLGFTFGQQPKLNSNSPTGDWLNEVAAKGWITDDPNLNYQVLQKNVQNLTVKANLEPISGFRIEVSANRKYSENHSEYFKVIDPDIGFEHVTPMDVGSFSISYLPVRTLFEDKFKSGTDTLKVSQLFNQFEENRKIIAQRLQDQNPYSGPGDPFVNPDGTINADYTAGYGPYAQDALIPAFLSAYNGGNASKTKLNVFKQLPLPNWRVTYNGLTKIGNVKKVLSNFSIKHGYSSTLTLNNFQTDLNFEGDVVNEEFVNPILLDTKVYNPYEIDELSGNFYSLYNIPAIIISEAFTPLVGVDFTFKNGFTGGFNYKLSRNLAMSFLDNQLSQSRSEEMTLSLGYRIKGLKSPFGKKGKKKKLQNDLNFAFDFSQRDNSTINYRLDQETADATTGNRTLSISPRIDYVVNKKLNLSFFYDFNKSEPLTTQSFPITTTKAGLRITFTLAQ